MFTALTTGRQVAPRACRTGTTAPDREHTIFLNGLALLLPYVPGNTTGNRAQTKECHVRHARNQAKDDEDNGSDTQRLGSVEHLLQYLPAHVLAGRYPGNHDGRGRRQQQ